MAASEELHTLIERALHDQPALEHEADFGRNHSKELHLLDARYPANGINWEKDVDLTYERQHLLVLGRVLFAAADRFSEKRRVVVPKPLQETLRYRREHDSSMSATIYVGEKALSGLLTVDDRVIQLSPDNKLVNVTVDNSGSSHDAQGVSFYYHPRSGATSRAFLLPTRGWVTDDAPDVVRIPLVDTAASNQANMQVILQHFFPSDKTE